MIYFRKIRWKNFLSTGNHWTEVKLDKAPNTLVIGVNGSGKSTLLDALTFALFGKPFRNVNKPRLVNSINDRECLVEIEFRIGNNEYRIERGIKPNVFNIYCNDVLQDQEAKSVDYQDYLETNILKFNQKAFAQIVILGASSFVPFMQLAAAERRAIIEELLDIRIFSSMNGIVKTRINDLKTESEDIKKSIASTLSKIEMQKKYVEEAKKNSAEAIEKKKKEIENLQNEKLKKRDIVAGYMNNINKWKKDVVNENEYKKLAADMESRKKKLESEMKFFRTHDDCPTCTQKISEDLKNQTILLSTAEIDKCKDFLVSIGKKISAIHETQKAIREYESSVLVQTTSINEIAKQINKLEEEIYDLQSKKVLSDDMVKISEDLVAELEELYKRRDENIGNKQYFDVAATLLKDKGIKTKIIKQYLPVINKLINKYLAAMDFFVNFEIDDEFNEIIKSRHRDEFKYDCFSEGEKKRIDLALLFTWRSIAKMKNSMSSNLLILDEVFDSSLDIAGTEEFMKLLNSLGNEANVFVISHKGDILIDKFKAVIKFEKTQNFSRIVP